MRLLLDTHAFLWWADDAAELSSTARDAIAKLENEVLFSMASCWELSIKVSLGKFKLATPIERFIPEQLGFRLLDISFRHVSRVATLPLHHRDPFDRLLASQVIEDELVLVSADRIFEQYGVQRVW